MKGERKGGRGEEGRGGERREGVRPLGRKKSAPTGPRTQNRLPAALCSPLNSQCP